MRFLLDAPFGAFDLETTSVDVEEAHIVTACTALLQPAEPIWQQRIDTHLAAVDIDIPQEATAVHGITTDFAREHGTEPRSVITDVVLRLGEMMWAQFPIVVMNGAYDFTVLDREARRHGVETLTHVTTPDGFARIVDIYVIDKWLDPYRAGGRKLSDLIRFYAVRHEGAHDATGDALAAARVAYRMALMCQQGHAYAKELFQSLGRRRPQEIADRFADLADMSAADLHHAQVAWRHEQQLSLREYLTSKGERNPDCDTHWPLRPFTQQQEVPSGT